MSEPTTPTQLLIDGKFVDAASGETLETYNPATGEVLAHVAAAGVEDVDVAVAAARRAFDEGVWSGLAPAERKAVMLRFADLVEQNLEQIAYLDSVNAGKPIVDCETLDLPDVVGTLRWYAESLDKVFGKVSPTGADAVGLITRQPRGVVAAVLPWNFPAAMLSWKLGPALSAGNSVIVKPPEQAPLSTLRIAELALEAGVPAGVFSVLPGPGEVTGRALGLHDDVDVVAFTGSTEVGREFLRYAADSNLKSVGLECGGKSPQIVFADAVERDVDHVADELANAAFWNNGQNCTAGSRILVEAAAHDALVAALQAKLAEWPVGDPGDRATKLGPLIEPSALERVLRYVDGAREAGATIVAGGNRTLESTGGWFVEPTIIDDVTPDMAVAREEIFGPVVAVLTFDTEAEAVRIANDSAYGLAASVFTHDFERAHRVSRAVDAGTVTVNCYGEGDITTPFGGFKTSGFGGRDNGLEAFDQYTEIKTTWFALGS
ncbi:aldehyde dehydrogenase [Pseudonocardia phyllosphaerae]|uniref:aldehyde dehydrogenase n=1 Tax=Pseudonocardia phyllosphaerae TaxID=3390502 RepID=UPI00397B9381